MNEAARLLVLLSVVIAFVLACGNGGVDGEKDTILVNDVSADIEVSCQPRCDGKDCGDNGCGGVCGECEEHHSCEEGACVLQPYCGDGACEPDLEENCDSCADDCTCEAPAVCFDEVCCTPDCLARQCGDDGCGGVCGECGAEEVCSVDATCAPMPCDSDLDCAEFGKVCDPLSRTCVACLTATDCGEGDYICEGKSCVEITPCGSSLDCDNQVCDEVAGFCVDCLDDADCEGDAICQYKYCIPITPCDSSLDCTGQVCNKDKGYCVDCLENADCGVNAECTGMDVCVSYTPCDSDLDCTPHGMLCDKGLGRCVDCLDNVDCPDVYHCRNRDCVLDVCVPGKGSCDGSVAVVCLDDGSGYGNPVTCGAEQYCDDGVCSDWLCSPDSVYCEGNIVKTCDAKGSSFVSEVDCSEAAVCVDDVCVAKVCEPSELTCTNDFEYKQCNLLGTVWNTPVTCQEDHFCEDGLCHQQICKPETTYCASDTLVETCNAKGNGSISNVMCVQNTTCLEGECVPVICTPTTKTCIGGKIGTCNATGSDYIMTACGGEQYCKEGACYDWVCEPDTLLCDANIASLCNADGSEIVHTTDCTESAQHCVVGFCKDLLCEPETRYCDGVVVSDCDATGTVAMPVTTCAAGTFCKEEGTTAACAPWVCTPGESYCSDDYLNICNEEGTGGDLFLDCKSDSGKLCIIDECIGCALGDGFNDDSGILNTQLWGQSTTGNGSLSVNSGQLVFSADSGEAYLVDLSPRDRTLPGEISFRMMRSGPGDYYGFRAFLFSGAGPGEYPFQNGAWQIGWASNGGLKINSLSNGTDQDVVTTSVPFNINHLYDIRITYDSGAITVYIDEEEVLTNAAQSGNVSGYVHVGFWEENGAIDQYCYMQN